MSTENSNATINLNDSGENQQHKKSNFIFHTNDENRDNNPVVSSVADSAYDSLVCSPFSPILISGPNNPNTSDYPDNFQSTDYSISPFQESSENDEVFKVSLEHINTNKKAEFSMCNSIFRPISSEREIEENDNVNMRNFYDNDPQSNTMSHQCSSRNSFKSHRSISTQTKFTLGSTGVYRPSSAPLQEGIEEELSEIETNAMESSTYQMTRNLTCHCIRSPMPDLIQPTFQRENLVLASRLSLIADQIDQEMSPAGTPASTNTRRARRCSMPALSDSTPGGSFLDLVFSIYHAFDNNVTRRRCATYSHNENDENIPGTD